MDEIADAEEREAESRRNKKGSRHVGGSDKTIEAVTDEDYDVFEDLVS
jgi:hypothetical protein